MCIYTHTHTSIITPNPCNNKYFTQLGFSITGGGGQQRHILTRVKHRFINPPQNVENYRKSNASIENRLKTNGNSIVWYTDIDKTQGNQHIV